MRGMPEPDNAPETNKDRSTSQTITCALCQCTSPVHYRVRSDVIQDWSLICPTCWSMVASHPGYQYGGTRKANRRRRKR